MNLRVAQRRLMIARQKLGVSRAEAGRGMGYAYAGAITNIEEGNPKLSTLEAYAKFLGVHIDLEVHGMRVITFFNHAGGIGKTSSVRDIGFKLSQDGARVLLIDTDPQANLTSFLLGESHGVSYEQTIARAMDRSSFDTLEFPKVEHAFGMHIVPSTLALAQLEQRLLPDPYYITRLRHAVRKLEGYDYVLIDSPPSIGQINRSALQAADHVVVPIPANRKGIDSTDAVIELVDELQEGAPRLGIRMFLVTKFPPSMQIVAHEAYEMYKERLPAIAPVSTPITERMAPFDKATARSVPVAALPKSELSEKTVREIDTVVAELLQALDASERAVA